METNSTKKTYIVPKVFWAGVSASQVICLSGDDDETENFGSSVQNYSIQYID